ncbi:MAG: hypothetical protein H6742_06705 [Alphaproteobacteria bacterium]|nr:hypothetical protein [Alphaproteobacteria bacterium]
MTPDTPPPPRPLLFLFPAPERTVPPAHPGPHPSTLTLHQLRYEELEPDEEQAVRAHLDACGLCRDRLHEQQDFRAAFLKHAPPLVLPDDDAVDAAVDDVLDEALDDVLPPSVAPAAATLLDAGIDEPANRPPTGGSWLRWAPIPLLLAAMALVAVRFVPTTPTGTVDPDGVEITRLKGAQDVQVLVEGQGVLDVGEALRPGDRIQIRVPAGAGAEAWVGDGEELIGRFDLSADSPTLSPFALSVDGAGGDEELVLIIPDAPLSRGRAVDAMQGDRMPGVTVRRFLLPVER